MDLHTVFWNVRYVLRSFLVHQIAIYYSFLICLFPMQLNQICFHIHFFHVGMFSTYLFIIHQSNRFIFSLVYLTAIDFFLLLLSSDWNIPVLTTFFRIDYANRACTKKTIAPTGYFFVYQPINLADMQIAVWITFVERPKKKKRNEMK